MLASSTRQTMEPVTVGDTPQPIEVAHAAARAKGHKVRFDMLTHGHGSAECTRPGCGMGLTIDPDPEDANLTRIHGSAVKFNCPGLKS